MEKITEIVNEHLKKMNKEIDNIILSFISKEGKASFHNIISKKYEPEILRKMLTKLLETEGLEVILSESPLEATLTVNNILTTPKKQLYTKILYQKS